MSRTERLRKGCDRGAEVGRRHGSRLADERPNDGQGQSDGTFMWTTRQKTQLELALGPVAKGEAWSAGRQGTEARMARADPERPTVGRGPSIEAVRQPGNLELVTGASGATRGARLRQDDRRSVGRAPGGPLARDQVPAS